MSVTFDAVPGRTFDARITEVGVTATRLGTTFPVRVRLTEADPAVRAGMAAEVAFRFAATAGRDLFVVPPVAVGEDRSGRFVFVVEPSDSGLGVVHRRAVTVGELTGDGLEILSGLSDGDRVVTAGVTRIQDGLRVRLRT